MVLIKANNIADNRRCCQGLWILNALIFSLFLNTIDASPDLLPLPCDSVKCPPMDEITCPDDSYVRELKIVNFPALIPEQTPTPTFDTSMEEQEIMNELFAQCCVVSKCACKTCTIPACGNHSLVIYETVPESMTPGKCCGRYECRPEPDCSEVSNTDGFWLTDCQRCKCLYGERICHKSCDEILKEPATAFCKSKVLNRFFSDGESWKEGCTECECHHGEKKCMSPFCRNVNCEKKRRVIPQNGCCPICLPATVDTDGDPSSADYDDEHGDDDDAFGSDYDDNIDDLHDFDRLPLAIEPDDAGNSSTPSTASNFKIADVIMTNVKTTTMTTPDSAIHSGSSSPCQLNSPDPAATYAVYPEVVEVVRPANNIDVLYAIIGCLSVAVVALSIIVCQMRAKQRSYRPVSNFDDNFNKTSSNIKKMNDYV